MVLLVGAAMATARSLVAQQKAMTVIGCLTPLPPPANLGDLVHGPIHQGLSETGFIEGQNFVSEYRWAEGHYDRLPALAADLVSRNVDLIITNSGAPPALAAKNATSTIPIVFTNVADPVGFGLVASLAHPGGNLTGFSNLTLVLTPKRFEMLCELVPHASVIALLVNPDNKMTEHHIRIMQEAARTKGIQLPILRAVTEAEIDTAFASLGQLQAGGLVVEADPFFFSRREQLVALASRYAIPATYEERAFVAAPDQLWSEPLGCLSPGRHLRWKNFKGRQARRSAGAATNDIRAGRQSQDRKGTRPDHPAIYPRPRRRGHRVTLAGYPQTSELPLT